MPYHPNPAAPARRWMLAGDTGALLQVRPWSVVTASAESELPEQPARAGDLHEVGTETLHLQCQGTGTRTVALLGGQGSTTTSWDDFRERLGTDVRTCAWDYPGLGWSTGAR